MLALVTLGFVATADVFWNPGDRILRHDSEFQAAKNHFASRLQIKRVECPPRLEDEITYVNNRYAKPNATAELDIMRVEATWVHAMTQSLHDLYDHFDRDELRARFDPRALDALTVNGRLLALPSFIDFHVLYYRADLLEKYNLSVPTTWDQLEDTAHAVVAAERELCDCDDFYGLMWQGNSNEILTYLTLQAHMSIHSWLRTCPCTYRHTCIWHCSGSRRTAVGRSSTLLAR